MLNFKLWKLIAAIIHSLKIIKLIKMHHKFKFRIQEHTFPIVFSWRLYTSACINWCPSRDTWWQYTPCQRWLCCTNSWKWYEAVLMTLRLSRLGAGVHDTVEAWQFISRRHLGVETVQHKIQHVSFLTIIFIHLVLLHCSSLG